MKTPATNSSGQGKPGHAVAALDHAMSLARGIIQTRDTVLADVTKTWNQSWYPRVAEANGRKFLHELDDVKDHLPDRTLGLDYLVYRELNLPLPSWIEKLDQVRAAYAKKQKI